MDQNKKIGCGNQKCTFEYMDTKVLGELFCFKNYTVPNGNDDQLISNLKNVIKNLNLAFPEMNYEMTNPQQCSPKEGGTGYTLNIIMKRLFTRAPIAKSKEAMLKMIKNNVLDIDLKYVGKDIEEDDIEENDNYMIMDDGNTAPIDIHPMTTLLLNSDKISDANKILDTLESCIQNSTDIENRTDYNTFKENIDFFDKIMDPLSYKLFLMYILKKCSLPSIIEFKENEINYISDKLLELSPPETSVPPPPRLWSNKKPSPSLSSSSPAHQTPATGIKRKDSLNVKDSKLAKTSNFGKSKKKNI